MKYFKSVLVGLAAVFVICILVPAVPTIVDVSIFVIKHRADAMGIKVSPLRWRVPSLAQLLFMLAVFGGGFLWELRKLARRQLAPATDSSDPPIS